MFIQSKNTFSQKARLWLIKHPKLNPYKFSFAKTYRKISSSFRMLPDFIIVGPGRSGTTSLYYYLIQHPHIIASSTERPADVADLHFFEYMISENINWYKSHFPTNFYKSYMRIIHKKKIITGELTATYFYHPEVPQRIKMIVPNVKILITLRNPVEVAYSSYSQQYYYGTEILSFEEAIKCEQERIKVGNKNSPRLDDPDFENNVNFNYLRHGIYMNYIKKWLEFFPKEQLLIIDAKQLLSETSKILEKIFYFFDLPNYQIKNQEPRNIGEYKEMNENTREFLIDFYRPYNEALYKLLGRKFDWDTK